MVQATVVRGEVTRWGHTPIDAFVVVVDDSDLHEEEAR